MSAVRTQLWTINTVGNRKVFIGNCGQIVAGRLNWAGEVDMVRCGG